MCLFFGLFTVGRLKDVQPMPSAVLPAQGRSAPAADPLVEEILGAQDIHVAMALARPVAGDVRHKKALIPALWARWETADKATRLKLAASLAALRSSKGMMLWREQVASNPDLAVRQELLSDLPDDSPFFRAVADQASRE